jgi:hypothetical protein
MMALGNILHGTFKPMSEPAVCDTSYCFYFCQKHALPDSRMPTARVPDLAGAS